MSMTEILVILALALVILGPDKLPGIARSLGRGMREFKKAQREIRASFEVEEVRRRVQERNDVRARQAADQIEATPEGGDPGENGVSPGVGTTTAAGSVATYAKTSINDRDDVDDEPSAEELEPEPELVAYMGDMKWSARKKSSVAADPIEKPSERSEQTDETDSQRAANAANDDGVCE